MFRQAVALGAGWYSCVPHVMQWMEAGLDARLPGEQSMQDTDPLVDAYRPGEQSMHDVLPGNGWYCPLKQC